MAGEGFPQRAGPVPEKQETKAEAGGMTSDTWTKLGDAARRIQKQLDDLEHEKEGRDNDEDAEDDASQPGGGADFDRIDPVQ